MTLKSMTGYASRDGALETDAATHRWTWDIRSVNGKSLDMRLRVPPSFSELDQLTRKQLTQKLARGNIQAHLTLETSQNDDALIVNDDTLKAVLNVSKKLTADHGLAPISADGLFSIKGLIEIGIAKEQQEDRKTLIDALVADFIAALDALVGSRANEGAALLDILNKTLDEIEALALDAQNAPVRAPDAIRAKLEEQINLLSNGDHNLNQERLHQEALLLAAKADIKEEIDRLIAHVSAARDLIAKDEPVGRRLDFLAQEFNREANTLCSKANDIAITNIGLALKAAIDQFREQVQNVE